ncbi:MAG: AdeC/AdeK/OprM family multidrug efflux complex outer membrane factor [Burkholderiales bacterium]|nr:AdeC/AdeK/OprM family multidrug efflux complex outer membrane factor [Burkholderiales bacterium]
MPYRLTLSTLTVAMLLAGCAMLEPHYTQPAAPVTANWPTAPDTKASGAPAAQVSWNDFVDDAKLRQVIDLALANNRDLRIALLNVEKTRAQYQIQRAALIPHINATGTENAARTPADLSSTGRETVTHAYNASVGLSTYEIDLFGQLQSLKDAAMEQYLSNIDARRSAQISLAAQVSTAWLTLQADKAHLQLAQQTFKNQQDEYALSKRRFDAGASSQLDLSQAEVVLDTARGDAARYTAVVDQDLNALTLLVGTSVPSDLLPGDWSNDGTALRVVPGGMPSDLLRNRPDILAAEHQLKSANANIGAARAAFFPSITLTSSVGTASNALNGLFKAGSRAWTFAPQINLPLFDGGVNLANLQVSKVNRDIAVAQYEKSIQTAFREVADAMAAQATFGEQIEAQKALVKATDQSYQLSNARFNKGVDSYLNVLDAQRTLYAARHTLINLQLAEAGNRITLFKALGGGSASIQ